MSSTQAKSDVATGDVVAVFGLLILGLAALFLVLSCGSVFPSACEGTPYGAYLPAAMFVGVALLLAGLAMSFPRVRLVPAAPSIVPWGPVPLMPAPEYSQFYRCDFCGQPLNRVPGRRGWYCLRCEQRR